jgi:hypothetical protein
MREKRLSNDARVCRKGWKKDRIRTYTGLHPSEKNIKGLNKANFNTSSRRASTVSLRYSAHLFTQIAEHTKSGAEILLARANKIQ